METILLIGNGPKAQGFKKSLPASIDGLELLFEDSIQGELDSLPLVIVCFVNVENYQMISKLPDIATKFLIPDGLPRKFLPDFETELKSLPNSFVFNIGDQELPYLIRNLKSEASRNRKLRKIELMAQNMDGLLSSSLKHLQKVKKIHQKVVPLRMETFKRLKLYTKYSAGESSGGDFFDVIRGNNKFFLIMSTASSYVASSFVLSNIEPLRDAEELTLADFDKFVTRVSADLKSVGMHKDDNGNSTVDLLIAEVDLLKYKITGYCLGPINLISNKNGNMVGEDYPVDDVFLEKATFTHQMERGEKIVICSRGAYEDYVEAGSTADFQDFVRDKMNLKARDLLDSMIMESKRGTVSSFLKYDASYILFEVMPNAIIKM